MRTHYIIERDNKVIFYNRNSACFADILFTHANFSIFNEKNITWKNEKLTFVCNNLLSKDVITKFLKKVATFGVCGTLVERPDFPLKNPASIHNPKNYRFVEVDLSRYECPKFFKFSIHVLRCLIEDPAIVRYYVENKTPIGLDNFQFLRICATIKKGLHGYFGNIHWVNYMGQHQIRENPPFKKVLEKFQTASRDNVTSHVCSSDRNKEVPANRFKGIEEPVLQAELVKATRELCKK